MLLLQGILGLNYLSFPFLKDGQAYGVRDKKEALKHLFLAFKEFEQLHLDTSGSFHSVRNLLRHKRLLDCSHSTCVLMNSHTFFFTLCNWFGKALLK